MEEEYESEDIPQDEGPSCSHCGDPLDEPWRDGCDVCFEIRTRSIPRGLCKYCGMDMYEQDEAFPGVCHGCEENEWKD